MEINNISVRIKSENLLKWEEVMRKRMREVKEREERVYEWESEVELKLKEIEKREAWLKEMESLYIKRTGKDS